MTLTELSPRVAQLLEEALYWRGRCVHEKAHKIEQSAWEASCFDGCRTIARERIKEQRARYALGGCCD